MLGRRGSWRDADAVGGHAEDLAGEHVAEVGGVLDGAAVGVGVGDDTRAEPQQDAAPDVDVARPERGAHVDGGPGREPPRGAHRLGAARRHECRPPGPGPAPALGARRATVLGRRRGRPRPGPAGGGERREVGRGRRTRHLLGGGGS